MNFYGQEKLLKELWYISGEVRKEKHQNLLFIAQSGYGKTALALVFSHWCASPNEIQYLIATKELNRENLNLNKKIIIIDEVHVLDAYEWLYEYLDAKKSTFIFCTNEYGDLPEPLIRRCFVNVFEPYSEENYISILKEFFMLEGIEIGENLIRNILQNSKKSPGYVLNLARRLSIIFKNSFMPKDEEELNEIFSNVLGIKNGLDLLDQRYIETLSALGGISGLERLILYSRIPRKVVEREIEPYLLEKKIIEITTKGRKLI